MKNLSPVVGFPVALFRYLNTEILHTVSIFYVVHAVTVE